jgi:TetR/AcrR family transcriptional repressor of nem operon
MTKAGQTKEFIIERTAPIFNKKGFGGTSLSDITTATGLTKGSIYGNFANKDEVGLAAFDYNLGKIQNIIRAEMTRYSSAKEKLLVYVDVYDNFLKHPFPEGGCPIMNTATECDDTHPELKKKAIGAINSWKKAVRQLIEKGIAAKEFNPKTDAEKIALSMIATIEGAIMITKLTGKINYRNAIMETVREMVNNL